MIVDGFGKPVEGPVAGGSWYVGTTLVLDVCAALDKGLPGRIDAGDGVTAIITGRQITETGLRYQAFVTVQRLLPVHFSIEIDLVEAGPRSLEVGVMPMKRSPRIAPTPKTYFGTVNALIATIGEHVRDVPVAAEIRAA